jgi:hypothetical protein
MIEGTPRATRGHQICVWCKLGHRSTRPRQIGSWEGKVCDPCARKIRTEYEKGLASNTSGWTEKRRAKEMTRMNRRVRIPR